MNPNVMPEGYQHDTENKRCYDCKHLKSALSWWCTNKEAIKVRGTSFPGIAKCPYWEPAEVEQPKKGFWSWITG